MAGRLAVQLATVLAENRRLRRVVKETPGDHILQRAKADALTLIAWRYSGYSVSRLACLRNDMSRRRWGWAVALLKAAWVVKDVAPALDDCFLIEQPEAAIAAVTAAVRRAEQAGIAVLKMRLPRNGGRGERSHSQSRSQSRTRKKRDQPQAKKMVATREGRGSNA
jgi:hypothetical protein